MAAKKSSKASNTTKKAKKSSSLAILRNDLGKIFKEDFTQEFNSEKPLPHIPTGSIVFDYLIGGKINEFGFAPCPGLPCGRITNIYGEASTGKTTFALEVANQVCKLGGTVLYLDWEHELAPTYARSLGVPVDDPEQFMIYSTDTMEQGIATIIKAADMGVNLVVIDSVGAGQPQKLQEQSVEEIGEEVRMGLVATLWSKYLPRIKKSISKSNTALLGISQLRS
ncbi:MAG: AAA family ATPase, partial [Bacteroidota bacterium]